MNHSLVLFWVPYHLQDILGLNSWIIGIVFIILHCSIFNLKDQVIKPRLITLCLLSGRAGLEITADHRSLIGKKLLTIGGKQGFNLKKKGKSWLPITMIGNFGNVISSPAGAVGRLTLAMCPGRQNTSSACPQCVCMGLHSSKLQMMQMNFRSIFVRSSSVIFNPGMIKTLTRKRKNTS